MVDRKADQDLDIGAILSASPYDQWVTVSTSGYRPSARYKHAAITIGEKLYIIGGSRNGRYLSDVQVFDFRTLQWSTLALSADPSTSNGDNAAAHLLPAFAGHSLVKWGKELLIIAGYSKESSDKVTVWSIDLETNICSLVQTQGKVPIARGGQSVTLIGSRIVMFGGEDRSRKLLNDLHILDLITMTWDSIEANKAFPAPRFDHTATAHLDQYLLIFGGSAHSTCFNDLHLLDLETMEWSQPETQGAYVSPRGGHAGVIVGENWYIVGGGDNKTGATETIILKTSKFVWSVATQVKERDSLASEGLTLCSTILDGQNVIVAFGGYNGKYNNEVFVLKTKPQELIQPRLLQSPAAAAAAASVTAAYAIVSATDEKRKDAEDGVGTNENHTRPENRGNLVANEIGPLKTEKTILESKLEEIRSENSSLQTKIDDLNNTHSDLSKELQSVQVQLEAERSRCLKLEGQIASIQKSLDSASSLEHAIEVLRSEISQIERDMISSQKRKSGGVWQWMTGTNEDQ